MLATKLKSSPPRRFHFRLFSVSLKNYAISTTIQEQIDFPPTKPTFHKLWKFSPVSQVCLIECNTFSSSNSSNTEGTLGVFQPKFLGEQDETTHPRPVASAFIKAQRSYHILEKPFYFMDHLDTHSDYFHFYFDYYPEIHAFQEFISSQDKDYYLPKYSASELKHYLKLFHQECMNGGIIPANNMHHYRNMCKQLLKLLDTDPKVAQSMARITQEIQFSEQIIEVFEQELDYVIDILKVYHMKYDNFKNIQTFEQLANKLNKELDHIKIFLRNHNLIDSDMFKNSIARLQLIKLIEILDKHASYNIIVLQHILQHPYLERYIQFLDSQSHHLWSEIGHTKTHFVNMLLFMNLIPDIYDFYKSAPKLYTLINDKSQSSIVRQAASEVLQEWGSYIVSSRDYTQGLQVSQPEIHIVSKDININYIFSSLLHIGVPLEKYGSGNNTPQLLGDCFDLITLQYADEIHYLLAHLQKQDFITIFSDKTIFEKYCQLRLAKVDCELVNLAQENISCTTNSR